MVLNKWNSDYRVSSPEGMLVKLVCYATKHLSIVCSMWILSKALKLIKKNCIFLPFYISKKNVISSGASKCYMCILYSLRKDISVHSVTSLITTFVLTLSTSLNTRFTSLKFVWFARNSQTLCVTYYWFLFSLVTFALASCLQFWHKNFILLSICGVCDE